MKSSTLVPELLSRTGKEKIPDFSFKVMSLTVKIVDSCTQYADWNFKKLKIKKGQTVIDYGCGPARYIRNASLAVGPSGRVVALDIHPLAIKMVKEAAQKHNLVNVVPVLAHGYHTSLEGEVADVIYALDVFHMIEDSSRFLAEVHRLLKPDGIFILEDGHQSRKDTLRKVQDTDLFRVYHGTGCHTRFMKKPAKQVDCQFKGE